MTQSADRVAGQVLLCFSSGKVSAWTLHQLQLQRSLCGVPVMKIVSLVPSATELVCCSWGCVISWWVFHECDYPPSVAGRFPP